ncbi:hypothetical protein F4677DRAFT_437580 [Hypoxylon crocopeplum]|nr:hypothetical protein F4677DRAFT_437580 [Hypoxylon crocopeplum]
MAGRLRPTSRRTESVEPPSEVVTRQTRRSARRPEASMEPEPRPPLETPKRGTRRRRRRSLESVATNDFPKSSGGHGSPELDNRGLATVSEPVESLDNAVSEAEDIDDPPEMEAARIQDMLDFDIPKLTRWSEKMYDILSSISEDQPSVDDRSRLNSIRKSYNLARLPFPDNNELFTRPINLPEDFDPGSRATIQVAICSGNLVSLLASIADAKFGKKWSLPILEQLDDVFPVSFSPASWKNVEGTERALDLAFHIRYRRLVGSLATNSSIEPFELATRIFCTQPVRGLESAMEALSRGPHKQLAGIDIDQDPVVREIFRRHVEELFSRLSYGRHETQSSLDKSYTQERLLDDLRSWALEIYQQLNKPKGQGMIRSMNPNPKLHDRAEHAESDSLFVGDNNGSSEDSDSASEMNAEGYVQLAPRESNQNFIDSSTTLAAVRQTEKAARRPVMAPPSNQQVSEGKGRASDTGDAIRRLEPGQILNRVQKRTRTGEIGDDEEENDDDFEVNEQLSNEARRARNENAIAHRPSPKRPRFSKQPRASSSQPLSPLVASSQRIASGRSMEDLLEDPNLRERDISVLSQEARISRRANYANKPRQVRVPWSESDVGRLLDLIADPSLSCSWSTMEKAGGFEDPRNQQALRDKARNIKVLYLEGDKILPSGFDQVALGQKERNSIVKCGRNPDRREDDLDAEGRVINNIYVD